MKAHPLLPALAAGLICAFSTLTSCTPQAEQPTPEGVIIVKGVTPGNSVAMAPTPPYLADIHLTQMMTTPTEIQEPAAGADSVMTYAMADFPALYEIDGPTWGTVAVQLLAMPGDTVIVDLTGPGLYPMVKGPKVTEDAWNTIMALHQARSEAYSKANEEAFDETEAQVKYQEAARQIALDNLDNAGSVIALLKAPRSDWNEILPQIKESAYESPLIAPTYYYITRCVNWDVEVVPARVEVR